jgi:hypothetical protein
LTAILRGPSSFATYFVSTSIAPFDQAIRRASGRDDARSARRYVHDSAAVSDQGEKLLAQGKYPFEVNVVKLSTVNPRNYSQPLFL